MKTIALIENGIVTNIIETDDDGWPGGIDITEETSPPGIGWEYAEGEGFTAPAIDPQAEVPDPPRLITNLAFDLRFTLAERAALEVASMDDPAAPEDQRYHSALLRVWQERARKALYTDLDDPMTRDGVWNLAEAGILAENRPEEILDAEIQPGERPGDMPHTTINPGGEPA